MDYGELAYYLAITRVRQELVELGDLTGHQGVCRWCQDWHNHTMGDRRESSSIILKFSEAIVKIT